MRFKAQIQKQPERQSIDCKEKHAPIILFDLFSPVTKHSGVKTSSEQQNMAAGGGGGFRVDLFYNVPLSDIKKTPDEMKRNRAGASGGSSSEADFSKVSLKTAITDDASVLRQSVSRYVTARSTAEARRDLSVAGNTKGGSSLVRQLQINKDSWEIIDISTKTRVHSGIHAPDSNFLHI